ncbi:MAG TPA: MarR family winged helix-turn-helix transcriptional regulator [Polyangiales bacterium]|nr:MarR family winged helix-turn-helix transcriptional regulator [Polyangiales bacterium]
MSDVDLEVLDLPTLAFLAGSAANDYLLARIRAGGHAEVRLAHGYVFQYLLSGARSIGELAELLGVTQQAASKSVLELEAMGYVVRSADVHDSRVRRVELSTQGRKVIERGRAARASLHAKLEGELGERTMNAARRAMITLLEQTGGGQAARRRRVRPARE